MPVASAPDHSRSFCRCVPTAAPGAACRYAWRHARALRDPKDYRLPGFSRQPWGRGLGAL